MKYIFAINGPPGSGKDTLADLLSLELEYKKELWAKQMKFATPLRKAVAGLFNRADSEIDQMKDNGLFGTDYSIRDVMIALSEDIVKPNISKTFFADWAVKTVIFDCAHDVFLVSDAGFQDEVERFFKQIKNLSQDEIECGVIRIDRKTTSFDNDSRQFIAASDTLIDLGVRFFDVYNNGTLDELKNFTKRFVDENF